MAKNFPDGQYLAISCTPLPRSSIHLKGKNVRRFWLLAIGGGKREGLRGREPKGGQGGQGGSVREGVVTDRICGGDVSFPHTQ